MYDKTDLRHLGVLTGWLTVLPQWCILAPCFQSRTSPTHSWGQSGEGDHRRYKKPSLARSVVVPPPARPPTVSLFNIKYPLKIIHKKQWKPVWSFGICENCCLHQKSINLNRNLNVAGSLTSKVVHHNGVMERRGGQSQQLLSTSYCWVIYGLHVDIVILQQNIAHLRVFRCITNLTWNIKMTNKICSNWFQTMFRLKW